MEFVKITNERFDDFKALHKSYKAEIGEESPTEQDFGRLLTALAENKIMFYGCIFESKLVGCCSVSCMFSTFNYGNAGMLEDFYILPEYRHKGIAKKMVEYAFTNSGVRSLLVGCADCDFEMYKALGFSIPLGNLLGYENNDVM